ncbi:MAG: hypothetical protein KDM91_16920, partial [Verrucomicrobiae bacterium]|nr:hypothetical protein [Verrucomicrobiae bacterium]
LKVVGSNPAPATNLKKPRDPMVTGLFCGVEGGKENRSDFRPLGFSGDRLRYRFRRFHCRHEIA